MPELIDMISNVGFPIAVVCYMFWRDSKQEEKHTEESKGFTEAINNNTLALTRLLDKMGERDE